MALYGKGMIKFNKKMADWNAEEMRISIAKSEAERKERIAILKENFYAAAYAIYENVFCLDKTKYHAWVDDTDIIPETFSFSDFDYAEAIIEELREYLDANSQDETPF